jgi:hypothetical protein
MAAEVTEVKFSDKDITTLTVTSSDVTSVSITATDTTILTSAPATINTANLNLSDSNPSNIARTASSGVSNFVSRADHVHSAANLLLDGGSY